MTRRSPAVNRARTRTGPATLARRRPAARWESQGIVAGLLAAVVMMAGCTTADEPRPSPSTPVGPEGAAFYVAPTPPAGARPGDLIWARPLKSPEGSTGHAILYWSTKVDGSLVAVSGVLFQPSPPPSQPPPIFAWAHGTFGLGDACAPSRGYFEGEGASLPLVGLSMRAGATFVASDFEGLGPPGEHPFMVNDAAARNVLDSVRAAARFTGAAAEAVLVGQSQGAAAVLVAAERQQTYAPDVRVRGTVAASVVTGMDRLDRQLDGTPYFGYVLMSVHGYLAAYRELSSHESALTDAGRSALSQIPDQCIVEILTAHANKNGAEYGVFAVLDTPEVRAKLVANDAGQAAVSGPILLVHGGQDPIPNRNTRELARRYCAAGATVWISDYPDRGHVNVMPAALEEVAEFLAARATNAQPANACATLT